MIEQKKRSAQAAFLIVYAWRFGHERRRMKSKSIVLVIICVLMAMLYMGCTPRGEMPAPGSSPEPVVGQEQEDVGPGGISITDMAGREVSLPAPATRVVALTAADVEILYAIGAGDTLVGRGEYCNYPPEALDVKAVQSGNETNI